MLLGSAFTGSILITFCRYKITVIYGLEEELIFSLFTLKCASRMGPQLMVITQEFTFVITSNRIIYEHCYSIQQYKSSGVVCCKFTSNHCMDLFLVNCELRYVKCEEYIEFILQSSVW